MGKKYISEWEFEKTLYVIAGGYMLFTLLEYLYIYNTEPAIRFEYKFDASHKIGSSGVLGRNRYGGRSIRPYLGIPDPLWPWEAEDD